MERIQAPRAARDVAESRAHAMYVVLVASVCRGVGPRPTGRYGGARANARSLYVPRSDLYGVKQSGLGSFETAQ